ncbi:MAG: TolC family protein [Candidatus Omnitrophica bacterium]|nr:TolC family protein [Candidatus Omnitrophota bacterium]
MPKFCRLILWMILGAPLLIWTEESPRLPVLELHQAVSAALKDNFAVKAAAADQQSARYDVSASYSAFLPHVSIQSVGSRTESKRFEESFFTAGLAGDSYYNRIQMSQRILDFSELRNISIAKFREQAAQWKTKDEQQTTTAGVISSYMEALRGRELMKVQDQRLDFTKKQFAVAQAQHQAGYRTKSDVLQAQLAQTQARQDLELARLVMNRAQSQLNRLLGRPASRRYRLTSGYVSDFDLALVLPEMTTQEEKLLELARASHPSVRVAQLMVEESKEALKQARDRFSPTLSLSGYWGYYDTGYPDFATEDWQVQMMLQVPVFEGGGRIARVRALQSRLVADEMRLGDVIAEIQNRVDLGILTFQEEYHRHQTALEAEIVAQENYALVMNRYESGVADSLELTQALTGLVSSRQEIVMTRYNSLVVFTDLLRSLGTIPIDESRYQNHHWLMRIE